MKKYFVFGIAIALSLAGAAHAETPAFSSSVDLLTRDLSVGTSGQDVVVLQSVLETAGYLTMPSGVAKGKFGDLTKRALARWQAAQGIVPASGYFGPKTRAALKQKAAGAQPITYNVAPTNPTDTGCPVGAVYNYLTGASCSVNIQTGPAYYPTAPSGDGSVLTVKGKMVDQLTGKPIANVELRPTNTRADYQRIYTNASGEFSIPIVNFNAGDKDYYEPVLVPFSSSCYNQETLSISKNTKSSWTGSGAYGATVQKFNSMDYIQASGNGPVLDMGNIPLWPEVEFDLTSDVPVTFSLYRNFLGLENGAGGNTLLKTSHALSAAVPLDYDFRATVTDANGKTTVSSFIHLPKDHGCAPVKLIFSNGQLIWQL